jgi:hypothetical protein
MRRLILTLVLAGSALAFAACGGGGGDSEGHGAATAGGDTAASVLAAAATSAADAGSSRVTFTITTQIPQQEAPITFKGEGEFDYVQQIGKVTYDFSELLAASGLDAGNEPAQVIVDKTTFYMKFPLLTGLIPEGKPWIKFDLEAIGQEQGLDLSQLQQLNQGDPSQILGYLRGAGTVEDLGTETIDGVETTHYRAIVDLDRVVSQAPAELRPQVQKQIDLLKEQSGITELPIEVWVDADGLPRRVTYSFDLSLTDPESKTSTILTMDFADYGLDVTVEPPPASEVTDVTELSAGAAG